MLSGVSFADVRNRLYNTGGFFLLGWAFHYGPFWTMNRQLFLHQ
jgi:dolichyl-phosphate-mannose-protein mannosyltransferase